MCTHLFCVLSPCLVYVHFSVFQIAWSGISSSVPSKACHMLIALLHIIVSVVVIVAVIIVDSCFVQLYILPLSLHTHVIGASLIDSLVDSLMD